MTNLTLTSIFIGLAILFILVVWNNKRNKEKLYNRKSRNFRENFYEKQNNKNNETLQN